MAWSPMSCDRVEATGKGDGGIRWITGLAPERDRMYRRLVAPLVPRIERSLGSGVFANRALDATSSLVAPTVARRRWRATLARALAPASWAVVSDVRECYRSIGAPAVRAGLARVGIRCPDDLEAFLRTMPDRGLPIGPEPSAVLANAVLAIADDAVARTGATIHRWVDDVVIVGPDRAAAAAGFEAWRSSLAKLGLAPHHAKTRPVARGAEVRGIVLGSYASGAGSPVRGIIRSR
jgi:hypothetical protein